MLRSYTRCCIIAPVKLKPRIKDWNLCFQGNHLINARPRSYSRCGIISSVKHSSSKERNQRYEANYMMNALPILICGLLKHLSCCLLLKFLCPTPHKV